MSSEPGFEFTELKDSTGLLGTKTVTRQQDGTIATSDYGNAWSFLMAPRHMRTVAAMRDYHEQIASKSDTFLVRAATLPTVDLSKPQRRRHAATDGTATLEAVPRWWLPFDLDDVAVPEGMGAASAVVEAALWVREHRLPAAFRDVRCVMTPTAKTGLRGPALARLRLWFLLTAAYKDITLREWMTGYRAASGVPADPRVLVSSQPVYTARARFSGMKDPLAGQSLAVVLDGKHERVSLDISEFREQVQRINDGIKSATMSAGLNWKAFLLRTVGGDLSFCEPLTRGLGIAARAGAADAEVLGFVAELLKDRADAGRRSQYGAEWVRSTLHRFRTMDAAADAAAEAAVKRVQALFAFNNTNTGDADA
jgi:hypothetical protein